MFPHEPHRLYHFALCGYRRLTVNMREAKTFLQLAGIELQHRRLVVNECLKSPLAKWKSELVIL